MRDYHSEFTLLRWRLVSVVHKIIANAWCGEKLFPTSANRRDQRAVALLRDFYLLDMVKEGQGLRQAHGLGFVVFEDGQLGHVFCTYQLDILIKIPHPESTKS
jgi:hypothetical protein